MASDSSDDPLGEKLIEAARKKIGIIIQQKRDDLAIEPFPKYSTTKLAIPTRDADGLDAISDASANPKMKAELSSSGSDAGQSDPGSKEKAFKQIDKHLNH